MSKKIIIIGGGIGGLTTAISLHKAGFKVKVFESVKELKPLGVGINTLPHCVRVLTNLGLLQKLSENAVETSNLDYFNKFGQRFWTEPRGKYAGYKWPQFSIHRGVLQMILLEEASRLLGKDAIRTNHHLSAFEQDDNSVTAHFIDKETQEKVHTETGDILIGADGISSVVRQQLYPNEGPPVYSGNILYRGTTVMGPYLDGHTMVMIGSNLQKMVVYPISRNSDHDGNTLINWVGNLREEDNSLTERDWNKESDKKRLVQMYKDWKYDWLDVPTMISKAKAVYEFPMSDRDPLDKWTFGRVTLLGDAAHPMYPIGSNGASQAILDAEYITICLSKFVDEKTAIKEYERERLPATSKVVLKNRAKGPDIILDMIEKRFPQGFKPEEVPHEELTQIMDNYRMVAGFDRKSLNQKAE